MKLRNELLSRRQMIGAGAMAATSMVVSSSVAAASTSTVTLAGHEGQRRADLGNGTFLNPIFPGDHPDPTVLKDGLDYYATFSSFDAAPGLTIWHSRDLVNWTPRSAALARPPGTVLAVDLCKHAGQYFLYIPVYPSPVSVGLKAATIFVSSAPHIDGPWSEPKSLCVEGYIDPGHVVGEDGQRYLFLNRGSRVRLTDDGLATAGPVEEVYKGWRYPEDWVTEAYALEGPKLMRRGEWFYLVSAVGGTAGPPTGHMVIVSRSKSIHGPWEHAPTNPIVRTRNESEQWWSRGHATLVEGPDARWWMVYHGYENGFRTLGRQTLLEPVGWSDDGWPVALGGDLSKPLPMPALLRQNQAAGIARSDDFSTLRLGTPWTFYRPAADELQRIHHAAGRLIVRGKGTGPEDCSPLCTTAVDHSYEVSVDLEIQGTATAGLLLFFSRRLFVGMAFDGTKMTTYRAGSAIGFWREPAPIAQRLQLRIVNERHIVTMFYRAGDGAWQRHGLRSEVSGYHANASDELSFLKPAVMSAGTGAVIVRNFQYRALPA